LPHDNDELLETIWENMSEIKRGESREGEWGVLLN
jgi:hypothetical protein